MPWLAILILSVPSGPSKKSRFQREYGRNARKVLPTPPKKSRFQGHNAWYMLLTMEACEDPSEQDRSDWRNWSKDTTRRGARCLTRFGHSMDWQTDSPSLILWVVVCGCSQLVGKIIWLNEALNLRYPKPPPKASYLERLSSFRRQKLR